MPRDLVILACDVCKRRNYVTTRNKQKGQKRLELKKYCKFCRKHTLHKETR
ncbi:TPA: 50S ribosomal protein L33 [Candidatus Poribacteria bacterium]|nr:50S ribosomal protein L33 [Candidatus Poribacteria bacterium]